MNVGASVRSGFLIRCTDFSVDTEFLYKQLVDRFGAGSVMPVVDLLGKSKGEGEEIRNQFPCEILEIDSAFIRNAGLHEFADITGWLCGDYVFYRAFRELDWDFAWSVEPDLHFFNGALDIIEEVDRSDGDLIGYCHRRMDKNWWWWARLKKSWPEADVSMVAFPLVRLSRDLALASMERRRIFTPHVHAGALAPNDESIVASTAQENRFSVVNLRDKYRSAFDWWGTDVKYSLDGLSEMVSTPQVAHSVVRKERLFPWLDSQWRAIKKGNVSRIANFEKSISTLTAGELREYVLHLASLESVQ